MKKYRGSGADRIAMRMFSEIYEASVTRWQQEGTDLPTWESHRRMLSEGKLSKVKHPSPVQVAGKTTPDTMQSGFKMPAPPVTQ